MSVATEHQDRMAEWRLRANAYLSPCYDGVGRWCLSEVLATLRHTLSGAALWREAMEIEAEQSA